MDGPLFSKSTNDIHWTLVFFMKNTIIVQKNMKSLLTVKFRDNYLLDVRKGFSVLQALILMFVTLQVKFLKRLLRPKLKIGRQKSKLLSKLSFLVYIGWVCVLLETD